MSALKPLSILCVLLCIALISPAQVLRNISKKVENKVKQRVDNKVDNAIDEGLDKAEGKGKKNDENKNEDASSDQNQEETATSASSSSNSGDTKSAALAFNSKYDFVPGEKLIAFEDFSRTELGDFPTRWNTNGTAEVVTLNKKEGKWLKINKEGYFLPEFITNIPENSTLEFDLGVNNDFSWYNNTLRFWIANLPNQDGFQSENNWYRNHAIEFEVHPYRDANDFSGKMWFRSEKDGNARLTNDVALRYWDVKKNTFAHISLWRQNQRLRVYVNGEKVLDAPRAFDAGAQYNSIIFNTNGFHQESKDDYYLISNIRLAIGAPDTRNKLMTEGKFVTRGILFDVNSDKIKPESYGVLKEIGNVLKENPTVKVKIVGHTDADGDDKTNMDLSNRRALAVKNYLVAEYGIAADNLSSEGKGESQPVDNNTSSEGKANNRRVEFIKL